MKNTGNSDRVKVISLFSGVGGLDIGLHQAGVETVACVEKDKTAAESLRINSNQHKARPEEDYISASEKYPWTVVEEDIHDVRAEDILEDTNTTVEEIDLVVGGPPCQTFSRSNEGSRAGTDTERGRLYKEFARVLHQVQPTAFIFENVRGLKSSNNGEDLKTIRKELEGDTYTTDYRVLNAADYGVPQTRKRIFIIGIKGDQKPTFPEPTHTENGAGGTEEWVTVGQALEEINSDETIEEKGGYENAIGSKYGPLLKNIPEGANYQHFSQRKYDPKEEEYVERKESELDEKEFDWRSRHWNYLLKIDRDRPSWTIQAAPGTTVGPFHWRARKLSLLEQMKLMTLPLNYYIAGNPSEIQEQIGNAVPPRFAEAIVQNLISDLDLNTTSFTEPEQPENHNESIARQPSFKVEVTTTESPWKAANRVLHAIRSEDAVVVEASQQAIPYAIDTLEIAKRHTGKDLRVELDEKIIEDKQENVVSGLEAKITTLKAVIKAVA